MSLKLWGEHDQFHLDSLSVHSFIHPSELLCMSVLSTNCQCRFILTSYSDSQRRNILNQNLDEHSLPDLLGGAFTCRFYQLLSFCYVADNCYSSGMCHVHLHLNNYGGKNQHRNLHTWCFILCGFPEGTGLRLCLHLCEINVPSSDSCYSIYSHRASVL